MSNGSENDAIGSEEAKGGVRTIQKLVPLSELCNEIYRYPTYYDIEYVENGVPEIRGTLINEDGTLDINEKNWRFISTTTSSKFPRTVLAEDDLVISVRGTIGKIGLVPRNLAGANMTANLIRVSPNKSKVYVGYLWRFMRSPQFTAALDGISSSTTIKTLKAPDLKALKIPLPSIAEQKRIAAILDKAEELRGLRRKALGELDAIVQSIFLEMFGDPVTNLKGWESKNLDECAERIQIGPFGTQLHQEDYIDNGIPAINPTHIKSGKILPDASFSVSIEKYQQLSQYHLKIDDVILGRRGEMGRCAMVSEIENGWLCGTGSLFVRPKHESLNPVYLSFLLSSRSIRKYLERASQGVTMANLNKTIVGQIPVSLPPLTLQQEFARRVEAIEHLKTTHRESLTQLDDLFASLQHRAFRGEL